MDEKVLHILDLCLQAKKKGLNIFFRYSPHVNEIHVFALKDYDNRMYPDEAPDYLLNISIYLDGKEDEVSNKMNQLEMSTNDYINERSS